MVKATLRTKSGKINLHYPMRYEKLNYRS